MEVPTRGEAADAAAANDDDDDDEGFRFLTKEEGAFRLLLCDSDAAWEDATEAAKEAEP
jgi:hypothetical protein